MEWLSIVFVILIEAGYSPERLNYFYMNDNELKHSDDRSKTSDNLRTIEHKWERKLKCAWVVSAVIIVIILAEIVVHVADSELESNKTMEKRIMYTTLIS